jgi:hypothetical protein
MIFKGCRTICRKYVLVLGWLKYTMGWRAAVLACCWCNCAGAGAGMLLEVSADVLFGWC